MASTHTFSFDDVPGVVFTVTRGSDGAPSPEFLMIEAHDAEGVLLSSGGVLGPAVSEELS